jgi:hypothetical protein
MGNPATPGDENRAPLSLNLEFLRLFDAGDESGPFGPRYHMVGCWRLLGPVDVGILHEAMADVVARHEPLRTEIVRSASAAYQRVHPPARPRLEVRDRPGIPPAERVGCAEDLVHEAESGTFDIHELPHLRGLLLRFDERDAVLLLQTHHTATDGWSMRLIARDLAAFYVSRRDGRPAALPPVRPYREFVAWERGQASSPATLKALKYWEQTVGGAQLTALPTDHPKSAKLPAVTAAYRFAIEERVIRHVEPVAKQARCSTFMVLLAAYYRLVHRLTGVTDLVVPTNTLGRGNGRFNDTVGSFFNFLPLRLNLDGCADVAELLRRTRTTCLGAYAHDIPAIQLFEAHPRLMEPAMRDELAPVTFQVLPRTNVLEGEDLGVLSFTELPWRTRSAPVVSEIPDGALWTLSFEPTGEAIGNLMYRTDRFDQSTMVRMAKDYASTLRDLLREAGAPLDQE